MKNNFFKTIFIFLFRLLVSSLSHISSVCPNIESWYAAAKASETYGPTPYTSASSITELGSIMGKLKMKNSNCH